MKSNWFVRTQPDQQNQIQCKLSDFNEELLQFTKLRAFELFPGKAFKYS